MLEKNIAFLRGAQEKDGAYGSQRNMLLTDLWENPESHRSWRVATSAIVAMAFLDHDDPQDFERVDRALDYVIANSDLKRPSDWDTDDVWGLVYGLQGCAHALKHPHYRDGERADRLRRAAKDFLARLERRQSPRGGFGYYADADAAWRSEWATTFTTSNAILALVEAREAGIEFDAKMLEAAMKAVHHCRTPEGSFTYDVQPIAVPSSLESIDHVQGSLGRIQVCNFALVRGGEKVPETTITWGLDQFFRQHRFLDCARMRPIPHEAYYKNAGYFWCYAHLYAGEVIGTLSDERRAEYGPKLWAELAKVMKDDGSLWDYPYMDFTHVYGTAFSAVAILRTLPRGKNTGPE